MSETSSEPTQGPFVSLSSVLRLPANKFGKRLRRVVEAIDRLHRVAPVKTIDVEMTRERIVKGRYHEQGGTGEPLLIEVSQRNETIELTFAHEVGHFLERTGLPSFKVGGRNWATDVTTKDWQASIRSSESFKRLEEIMTTEDPLGADATTGQTIRGRDLLRYLRYLQSEKELWARSYAQ